MFIKSVAPLYKLFPLSIRQFARSIVRGAFGDRANKMFSEYSETVPDPFYSQYHAATAPSDPSAEKWDALLSRLRDRDRPSASVPAVDVIIPVYKGFDETLACIYSVLDAENVTPVEIVVIDDSSPDQPLIERLAKLSKTGFITLIRNEQNLGFVATVNRGMGLHSDRDIVLLNSDTEVYHDWIDRLRSVAHGATKVATVTPLATNGEICSYPYFLKDNYQDIGPYDLIDDIAKNANVDVAIASPTGIGFCMYVNRTALDTIGTFDEAEFGKGYGEETDFCLRAEASGWTNVIAANIFVRHVGGTSFGTARNEGMRRAARVIERKHPQYMDSVRRFVDSDPTFKARRSIDMGRMRHAMPHDRTVLHIYHGQGGGIGRNIEELTGYLLGDGWNGIVLSPEAPGSTTFRLVLPHLEHTPNALFSLEDSYESLLSTLSKLDVKHIHVHHLKNFPDGSMVTLRMIADSLGVPYDVTMHDYYSICPRVALVDASRSYCGEPEIAICETCVSGLLSPPQSVARWRDEYHGFLARARNRIVHHEDVSRRLGRYFPDLAFTVRPHIESDEPYVDYFRPRDNESPLRVAVIGAISEHKGLALLKSCVDDAARRQLPIHYVVIGFTTDDPAFARFSNISITGRYVEADLPSLILEQSCHLAWFSSVWPETYAYTLSWSVRTGIFPVAFDIGVIAARIKEFSWGELMPVKFMSQPAHVNDALLSAKPSRRPSTIKLTTTAELYPRFARDYYGLEP